MREHHARLLYGVQVNAFLPQRPRKRMKYVFFFLLSFKNTLHKAMDV